jgi:hypothetical protein
MTRKLSAFAAIGAFAAVLSGCGYSTKSLLPEGVRTVAIDIFANDTYYREIEFRLARELSQEVNTRTTWKLDKKRNAEALISGRILSVQRPTLIENDADRVSEQAVILRAEVRLESLKDARLLDRFVVANRAEFIVERAETLDTAFAEAIADLAEQIVNHLQHRSFLVEMGVAPAVDGEGSPPPQDPPMPRALEPASSQPSLDRREGLAPGR